MERSESALGLERIDLAIAFENAAHGIPEALEREWLGDKGKSLFHHVALNNLAVVITGHEEHAQMGFDREQVVDEHGAAHAGHYYVRQD
jgi:hypothetical protein